MKNFIRAGVMASALALSACGLGLGNDEQEEQNSQSQLKQTYQDEVNKMKADPNYAFPITNLSCNEIKRLKELSFDEALKEYCEKQYIEHNYVPWPIGQNPCSPERCVELHMERFEDGITSLDIKHYQEMVGDSDAKIKCYENLRNGVKQINAKLNEVKTNDDCRFLTFSVSPDSGLKLKSQDDMCKSI